MTQLVIRECVGADWPAVWAVLQETIRAGDTYSFSPDSSEREIRSVWIDVPSKTFVACDLAGETLGTYFIKPNQPGLGAHLCNCGYVVASRARGQGVAAQMCEHSQAQARRMGFRGMQFNFVVSTNTGAIRLWERLGFSVVGRVPGAFNHRKLGYVDTLIMFKQLTS